MFDRCTRVLEMICNSDIVLGNLYLQDEKEVMNLRNITNY